MSLNAARPATRTILLSFLLLFTFAATLASSQKSRNDDWAELLPPGEGRESVLNTCSSCHNLRTVVDARKSRENWAKSINDMIQRGAPVFPEEIEPLTAYLSKVFGLGVPKLVNINTASREELQKLPDLKPDLVERIITARGKVGSFKNAEELRRTLRMDGPDFEKLLYRFKYHD